MQARHRSNRQPMVDAENEGHPTKQPRLLKEAEKLRLQNYIDKIIYSDRYSDAKYEYRHVTLPKSMLNFIPKDYFILSGAGDHHQTILSFRILLEEEWRDLGIQQSLGWQHYETHSPEPHILLFKRPKNFGQPQQRQ